MRVIEIPTNKPVIRDDRNDKIYSTKTNKFKALCDEVDCKTCLWSTNSNWDCFG